MSKYRDFAPLDKLPATFTDALCEFLGSASPNFALIIKPTDSTTLEVPAGTDNNQVAIAINGMWRYITATIQRASPGGSARQLDVHVTGTANSFAISGGVEVDDTDYTFALAITEVGASPAGAALSRKVGTATWNGSQFTSVDVAVGPQSGTARHAHTHDPTGSDPLPNSLIVPTGVAQPARVAGTVYQPNTVSARPTLVIATVDLTAAAGDTAAMFLKIGSTSPPGTTVGYCALTTPAATPTLQQSHTIMALVPVDWYYELVAGTGGGTATVGTVSEFTL